MTINGDMLLCTYIHLNMHKDKFDYKWSATVTKINLLKAWSQTHKNGGHYNSNDQRHFTKLIVNYISTGHSHYWENKVTYIHLMKK